MDIAGIKHLFGQRVLADAGKEFVGTLEPIAGSQDTVTLAPLDAATANNYPFAINGVTALGVSAISFIQKLS
ncbi:MAG TPA: hypothetical protein VHX17_00355 [Candidatus Cybelea sp.]|jgi:hypothetical protein|nr:hypothetical protein [Candidatus Cybelea sp.]